MLLVSLNQRCVGDHLRLFMKLLNLELCPNMKNDQDMAVIIFSAEVFIDATYKDWPDDKKNLSHQLNRRLLC